MDDGYVQSLATSSPFPVFKGVVSLSEIEWRVLEVFSKQAIRSPFRFKDGSGSTVYAKFQKPPVPRSQRLKGFHSDGVAIETTYEVEIVLGDETDLITRSKKEGVIFKED